MNVESHRRVSLAEAKIHLSELISAVEAGETVEITKRSKLVATVSPPTRPIDLAWLQSVTDSMPYGDVDAGDAVRRMRDAARY